MDAVFKRTYKNAEYELIIEEDCITTSKIYIDGELAQMQEYSLENGGDVPYSKKAVEDIYKTIKEDIDRMWEENFNAISR